MVIMARHELTLPTDVPCPRCGYSFDVTVRSTEPPPREGEPVTPTAATNRVRRWLVCRECGHHEQVESPA
jgi:hypothetical protein